MILTYAKINRPTYWSRWGNKECIKMAEIQKQQNTNDYVPKCELWTVCQNIDAIRYIMQDIEEDYFLPLNPKSEDDKIKILWDFGRMRAKAHAVSLMVDEIRTALKKNDVFAYSDKTA